MQRCPLAALTLALALALAPGAIAQTGTRLIGSFDWHGADHHHGGWSGIELSADGTAFIALSDRGYITAGRLIRSETGRVTAVEEGPLLRLKGRDGRDIAQHLDDSEGLAQDAEGRLYVSFEGRPRIWRYDDPQARPKSLPTGRDFSSFLDNAGLEALAIGPDGALYTLPEGVGVSLAPLPVYRYADGAWQKAFTLPRRGDHLPVGADFGPDGKFYLLERHFSGLIGFSTRVRRFTLGPDGPTEEEVLLTTPVGRHGNLEGLAVWQDDSGAIRLTMVSDDNLNSFQRSQIVDYAVRP